MIGHEENILVNVNLSIAMYKILVSASATQLCRSVHPSMLEYAEGLSRVNTRSNRRQNGLRSSMGAGKFLSNFDPIPTALVSIFSGL